MLQLIISHQWYTDHVTLTEFATFLMCMIQAMNTGSNILHEQRISVG